jgi:hypothetical protein
MNWKAEIASCAMAVAFMGDATAQSNSQPAETNRTSTVPAVTGTIGFSDRFSTNWVFQVLLPDGSVTNITVYGVTHNPTNTLFEWVRTDETRASIPVGPGPIPPRRLELINSPTRLPPLGKFQPVGDYWLPGEFENLFNKGIRRSEQRRSEAR